MVRAVVNVATDSWCGGQTRLKLALDAMGENLIYWCNELPPSSPPHRDRGLCAGHPAACVPYAFKAFALKEAANRGVTTLLWADACIVPRDLTALWERIERDGYWMSRQGYSNYQWTADGAYPDLFPQIFKRYEENIARLTARAKNRKIQHVVATTFGISLAHEKGIEFLAEYFRLASETTAFCGPWQNSAATRVPGRNTDRSAGRCGPDDVLGHRHDQTAASVIAWRLGFNLTDPPDVFSYRGGETDKTVLIADGAY